MIPVDQHERDRAIHELDQNVVVMAGAGTGKTTLLIDRILNLVLKKEIPLERIVALTFTKKAAEEMRERLEAKLRLALVDHPELAKKALDSVPRSTISTIHSFAGDLIRLYPIQAHVDPLYRVDEGNQSHDIFRHEWDRWLTDELSATSKRAGPWKKLLSQLELADLGVFVEEFLSPEIDLEQMKKQLDIRPLCRAWVQELDDLMNSRPLSGRSQMSAARMKAVRGLFLDAAAARPLQPSDCEMVEGLEPSRPPSAWADDPEARALFKRLVRCARALSRIDNVFFESVLKLVLPFVKFFRSNLAQRGLVPFSGLLVQARDLLRDNKGVRAQLKSQWDTFLVDEFQDTDPLQGEIMFYMAEALGAEAMHWRHAVMGPGRIFVVGDPKQSIYRFRGADIAAYEEFCDHLFHQGALTVSLTSNFRSRPDILDNVNKIFPPVMIQEQYVQPPYVPLVAARTDAGPAVHHVLVEKNPNGEKLSADDYRQREAAFIAEWIDRHGVYKDVALLFRTATSFEPYMDALKNRGIPYLAEGEKSFYRRPEVMELLTLLACIDNSDDKLSLVGVLRSPLGGLTDKEILTLSDRNGLDLRHEPPLFKDKIGALYKMIRSFAERVPVTPVAELIHFIFQETWLTELALQTRYGEQAFANLLKIERLAHDWTAAEPLTLKTFVQRFVDYRDDARDEGENPLADVQYDAVKLMTIHKAKGLEFPVVFLPNICASKKGGRNSETLVRRDWRQERVGLRLGAEKKVTSSMVILEDDAERHSAAEEVRVFYVAATRAKENLFFMLWEQPGSTSDFAGFLKKTNVWPTTDSETCQRIPYVDMPFLSPKRETPAPLSAGWDAASLGKYFVQRRAEFLASAGHQPAISPSTLLREHDKSWARDDDDETRLTDPITLGLVCHKVLEEWDFETAKKFQAKKIGDGVKRAVRLFGVVPGAETGDALITEAETIIKTFVASASHDQIRTSKIVGREIPFFYPLNEAETSQQALLMRGVIDLLYERDGKLIIADYKTNRVESETIKTTMEHYRLQGDVYKKGVRLALGRDADFELVFLRTGETVRV